MSKECPENKILNKSSGRCVKANGIIGRRIRRETKQCLAGKIYNEKTNRCINDTPLNRKKLNKEQKKEEQKKEQQKKEEQKKEQQKKEELPKPPKETKPPKPPKETKPPKPPKPPKQRKPKIEYANNIAYDILNIKPNATDDEIRTSYLKLSRKYHPDKNADSIYSKEIFQDIKIAYDILKNKSSKSYYDLFKSKSTYDNIIKKINSMYEIRNRFN